MNKEYIKVALVAVITVMTLGFVPGVMFPYVAGKLMLGIFFITLLSLIFFVVVYRKRSIAKPSWITKGFLIISLLSLCSIAWSGNPWVSLWGSDGRGEGIAGIFLISILSFFIDQLEIHEKRWMGEKIIAFSVIVTLYGVYELIRDTTHRSEGFHGNSILFAMYCLTILAIGIVLYITKKKKWLVVPIVLSLLSLLATQTRGILLAVLVSAMVWGILQLAKKRSSTKKGILIGSLVVLIVVVGGLRYIDTHTQFFQEKLPFIHRIISLDNTLDSDKQRVFICNTAWNAFLQRPWFGYGSQMFYEAFDAQYDARLTRYGFSQVWSDRAHNVYLDILVMYGLLGVMVYGGFGIYIFHKVRTLENRNEIIAIIVGFGIAYLFEFTGIADTVLLVVLMHLICEIKQEKKEVKKEMAALFIIPLLGIMSVTRWYDVSQSVAHAISQKLADNTTGIALEKINTTNIFKRDYLLRMADLAFRTMQNTEVDKHQADAVAVELDTYLQVYPSDVAMIVANANIHLKKGIVFADVNELENAEKLYTRASELAPNKQTMYLQIANIKVMQKDFEAAEEMWTRAYELDKDNQMIAYQFGYTLLTFDRTYESATVLRTYFNSFADNKIQFIPTNQKELSEIAQSAADIHDIDLLAYVLGCIVTQNPQNEVAQKNLEQAMASGQLQAVTMKGIEKILKK